MTTPPKMQFNDLPADLKRMVFSKVGLPTCGAIHPC